MRARDRVLGMGQSITRRDFIGGVGVALSGSLLACPWAETDVPLIPSEPGAARREGEAPYPPTRTGLRGSHEGSFEVAHQLRDGTRWEDPAPAETGEFYDLVIVGAGLSGLSAAWFYREAAPGSRILILDNHDDFGGHAKRNEFWHEGRMLVSHGGTINIEDFNAYGEAAARLIRGLGIDVGRYSEFFDENLHASLGLREAVFFDRETFGRDQLVVGEGEASWREFLARTPLSEAARDDIARLYETRIDYLPHLSRSEKRNYLRRISYRDFLADVVGIGPEALLFLNDAGYWAIGIDGLSAWGAATDGEPGTEGMGFAVDDAERAYFQFPDGNASIARLLVRSLIPAVAPGSGMEDIVTARFDYGQLDREGSPVRVRLDSMAVRVLHRGTPQAAEEVEVTYVRNGRAARVRAGRVALACYNSVIPYLCEELPELQKQALSQALKAPLVYTNVLLRNWTAFEKLGVDAVRCPGSYFEDVNLSRPISIGAYRHAASPEDPTVVRLFRVPLAPGLSPQEQWKAGRHELLSASFETFERKIREQLRRILSPGGFDPARDIAAITVNRWPHGYAYGQDSQTGEVAFALDEVPPERSSWLIGRKRFGRIAIANSDAAAMAMTEGAIGQAHRAVMELVSA